MALTKMGMLRIRKRGHSQKRPKKKNFTGKSSRKARIRRRKMGGFSLEKKQVLSSENWGARGGQRQPPKKNLEFSEKWFAAYRDPRSGRAENWEQQKKKKSQKSETQKAQMKAMREPDPGAKDIPKGGSEGAVMFLGRKNRTSGKRTGALRKNKVRAERKGKKKKRKIPTEEMGKDLLKTAQNLI